MENNITHINQYCLEHSNQESDLLKEIREYTYKTEHHTKQRLMKEMKGNCIELEL